MNEFHGKSHVQIADKSEAGNCTSNLPTICQTSFAEGHEFKEETESQRIGKRAEGSLLENVTPPALRSDGVTFSKRLRCLSEVRLGKGEKSGWLSANDIECLEFISFQGIVTIEQLWRAVVNRYSQGRSQRHLYRRVEFWLEHRIVQSFKEPGSKRVYLSISRRGIEAIQLRSSRPLPYPPPPKTELAHTLALTEFRLAAEEAGKVTRWVSDRCLRLCPEFPARLGNYCPDAYWVTRSGKRIFLEYERTRKTKARRQEKFLHFAQEMGRPDRYMDMVVWVADGASREMLESIVHTTTNQKVLSTDRFLAELARKASS